MVWWKVFEMVGWVVLWTVWWNPFTFCSQSKLVFHNIRIQYKHFYLVYVSFNGICYNNRVSWNGVRSIAIYDDSFVRLFILRHWSSYARVPSCAGSGYRLGVLARHNALILYIYNICIQSIIFPLFMLTFWTGRYCFSRLYFFITTIPELSGWNRINLLSWPCCYPLALAFIRCHILVWKRGTGIILCLLYNNIRCMG